MTTKFVKTEFVNNEKGVLAALDEFRFPDNVPVVEVVAVDSAEPIEIADINDDLKRELAFYNQAHAAVLAARKALLAANVPFSRPEDYFAEMVKTDAHMAKIRTKLIEESASIKKSEEAKRQRDMKKYGKQVQAEVLKERKAKEKSLSDKVASIKKKRKLEQATDASMEDDIDIAIMSDDDSGKPAKKRARTGDKPAPNKKRMQKNVKYGFGGKKRGSKRNSADSVADFKYSSRGGADKPTKAGKPGKKPAAAKRPGKAARQATRNKKN
ncbi:rRNA-processing protein EBP2 [Blastocladiella emersonii ATCC 22665]|nr:rRNA-processing protein EBP2 [Blastocladiella emersonii ATCC 22665]